MCSDRGHGPEGELIGACEELASFGCKQRLVTTSLAEPQMMYLQARYSPGLSYMTTQGSQPSPTSLQQTSLHNGPAIIS